RTPVVLPVELRARRNTAPSRRAEPASGSGRIARPDQASAGRSEVAAFRPCLPRLLAGIAEADQCLARSVAVPGILSGRFPAGIRGRRDPRLLHGIDSQ